jgi:hypothetical protein
VLHPKERVVWLTLGWKDACHNKMASFSNLFQIFWCVVPTHWVFTALLKLLDPLIRLMQCQVVVGKVTNSWPQKWFVHWWTDISR